MRCFCRCSYLVFRFVCGILFFVLQLLRAGVDKEAVEPAGGRTPLHLAALGSNTESVRALVAAGANIEARDSDGRTPLHLSCMVRSRDPAVPLCLMKHGAVGSMADAQGTTPLDIAVRSGWTEIVRALLSSGTAPRPCAGNLNLLYEVVRAGSASIVAALVDGGWETGVPTAPAAPGKGETYSPLMLAADSGRPDVVKELLRGKQKGFPDEGDARGYTALHLATMKGSASIAEALLGEGGANPDVANADGDTALHIAVATRRTNVGEVILRSGVSVDLANRRGHTALHFAAALGLTSFAKELLDRGADLEAVDGVGVSATGSSCTAAYTGSSENEKKLANLGRVVGTKEIAGNPKNNCRAAKGAAKGTAKGTAKGGAKGGVKGGRGRRGSRGKQKEGRTPLHYAAMNGRVEVAQLLLRAGAAPTHRWNSKRESPLFVAAKGGHAEVVGLLLEKMGSGEVDLPALSGETPLSAACANGHSDVVDEVIFFVVLGFA